MRKTIIATPFLMAFLLQFNINKAMADYEPDAEYPDKVAFYNIWSGAVITVYSEGRNNWLWAYYPYDMQGFGNDKNWLVKYNSDSSITFKNAKTGNCMLAYSENGLTHDNCDGSSFAQRFTLIPSTSGAVQVKSSLWDEGSGRCIAAYSSGSYKKAFSLTMKRCAASGEEVNANQLWVVGPAIENSRVP